MFSTWAKIPVEEVAVLRAARRHGEPAVAGETVVTPWKHDMVA